MIQGQPANADILVPTLCPCHGCNELVVRAGEPANQPPPLASDRKFMQTRRGGGGQGGMASGACLEANGLILQSGACLEANGLILHNCNGCEGLVLKTCRRSD